jgi:F-type H+-transporting ATPase subunit delta
MARKLSRRAITEHIAERLLAGDPQEKLMSQLAAYLIETRRTNELNLMVRDIQYSLAQKGHVAGTVVSAFELSAAAKKSVEAFAKDVSGASAVTLEMVVDPSVLGGIKVSLPGKELDATVSRKLTLLKTRYKKAIN